MVRGQGSRLGRIIGHYIIPFCCRGDSDDDDDCHFGMFSMGLLILCDYTVFSFYLFLSFSTLCLVMLCYSFFLPASVTLVLWLFLFSSQLCYSPLHLFSSLFGFGFNLYCCSLVLAQLLCYGSS